MRVIWAIESSRWNGAISRGPITPEGKRISPENAIRHELCARSVTLANESEPEILALLETLTATYEPQDAFERLIVSQIAVYNWRIMRSYGIEADLMNNELEGQAANAELAKAKPRLRTALAFDHAWGSTAAFRNLNIYEARMAREIVRLERRLDARRRAKQNFKNEPSPKIGQLPEAA